MTTPAPIAELTSLTKSVRTVDGSSLTILQDATVTIWPGEFVALTGPSGAGKTTLMNIIGLLDAPSGGRYQLASIDVSSASERTRTRLRAEHIGFIFQAFHLSDGKTTAENVELGLICQGARRQGRRRRALDALATVGLAGRASAMPSTLSGGEQQRTAIARALVRNPRLVLADEPTGNLDAANADVVIDLLTGAIGDQSAVLMVTHDPRLAARADRTIALTEGRTAPLTGARD